MAATADYPTLINTSDIPRVEDATKKQNRLSVHVSEARPSSPQPQRNTSTVNKPTIHESSSQRPSAAGITPDVAAAADAVKYPHCVKLNIVHDGQLLTTSIIPKYESSNTSDPTKRSRFILRPPLEMKKMEYIESLIHRMMNSETGIEMKEKKKMFGKTTSSSNTAFLVSGQQITDWLEKHAGFLHKTEATRYADRMMAMGYIIPEKVKFADQSFAADTRTMYTFQCPALWRSKFKRKPTDEEYAIFLYKYINKYGGKGEEAETKLEVIKKTLSSKWDIITQTANRQLGLLDQVKKEDGKSFTMQEIGFWKSFRLNPDNEQAKIDLDSAESVLQKLERDRENQLKLSRRTEQQMLDAELKAMESLKQSDGQKRIKASAAIKAIAVRCDLFEVHDPLLKDPEMGNPWIKDDTSVWEVPRKTPTATEVRIWVNSFSDLLRDPLGVKYFFEFLVREHSTENMKFWAQVENLHSFASTRSEFTAEAVRIYNEFIPDSAPQELNLPSNLKTYLNTMFQPDVVQKLPYDCFKDAQKHVYSLMAKDSYARFVNSDYLSKIHGDMKAVSKSPAAERVLSVFKKMGVEEEKTSKSTLLLPS